MTCGDVDTLLDAFLDSELPPPMLVAVARHAGGCETCDAAIRSMTDVRERLAATVEADAAAVDLSGLWAGIEQSIEPTDRRRRWVRRARGASMWAAAAAIAASAVLAVRGVQWTPESGGAGTRFARRLPPNHALIDRLAGHNVALAREQKSGTTLIWVNHTEEY